MFYPEALTAESIALIKKINASKWLSDFYLAGGTGLALWYGHRQSVDLDFFRKSDIATKQLIKKLSSLGRFKLLNEEENTVEGILEKVKVSFMTYPYGLLRKRQPYDGVIFLAEPLDIAVMKVGAIADRNTKKDFIDLYVFLRRENMSLKNLLSHLRKKFSRVNYDIFHLYKSLVYFEDADKEPMPRMFIDLKWEKVRRFFKDEVRKLVA